VQRVKHGAAPQGGLGLIKMAMKRLSLELALGSPGSICEPAHGLHNTKCWGPKDNRPSCEQVKRDLRD
jgi:hypothetical protein